MNMIEIVVASTMEDLAEGRARMTKNTARQIGLASKRARSKGKKKVLCMESVTRLPSGKAYQVFYRFLRGSKPGRASQMFKVARKPLHVYATKKGTLTLNKKMGRVVKECRL